MTDKTVLVTGGTGFVGVHVVVCSLQRGYRVRTTVRSLNRADVVLEAVRAGGISKEQGKTIQFFEADLQSDKGWDEACRGCDFVLHVASPLPASVPRHADDLIKPARDGTLRVLTAANKSGTVKRVVVTSSFAAIGYGHGRTLRAKDDPFTEKDWSELDMPKSTVGAYETSKTLAEKAAWQWINEHGDGMELAMVNPTLVFGPSLAKGLNASLEIPKRLLAGELLGLPDLYFGIVDVRDVADLHLLVMEAPHAAGQRYIAVSDEMSVSMRQIALFLREGLSENESRKIPTRRLPDFVLKLVGLFDKGVAMVVPELGLDKPISNAKAKQELGWKPRSARDAVLASAESLLKSGMIKD